MLAHVGAEEGGVEDEDAFEVVDEEHGGERCWRRFEEGGVCICSC